MEQTMKRNKNKHKTKIDWDLNVYCPEQWDGNGTEWDPDLWKINARIYERLENDHIHITDTEYTITLLEKEARALGLVDWGKKSFEPTFNGTMDGWLDIGLDGMIDLYHFNELYRDKCSDRVLEFLDQLPQYREDVPERMVY